MSLLFHFRVCSPLHGPEIGEGSRSYDFPGGSSLEEAMDMTLMKWERRIGRRGVGFAVTQHRLRKGGSI